MSTSEFLLEVGTEEIPARMMDEALPHFQTKAASWAFENNLISEEEKKDDRDFQVFGTPRRLILHAELPEKQPDETVKEKGPPKQVAYDDGEPTQALEGFCGQHDVSPDQVEVEEMDGGTYTVLELEKEGRRTEELIREDIEELILGLPWPKSMRWESSNTEFVRPIRWLVAFFDDEPINLDIGPVSSGTETRGLRFTEYERINVTDPDNYFSSLRDSGIEFEQDEREEIIREGAKNLAGEVNGSAYLPDDLVDEVNYLVESPTPFRGEYDEEFLDLPPAVLEEAMISHQKYFPVRGDNGLLPYFIGVRNGGEQDLDTVRRGNEKVIRARLSDAVFFYEKDLEQAYEEYREELKGVVFQENLGSLYDKTERMASIAAALDRVPETLEKIARHSKNDHVTEIVGEFPKLQGTMGKIYARESGWSDSDVEVIEQHYHPKGREDEIPESTEAQWLAVIDRLDTLIGFFGIGERVSGSSDPYGLRRDALGLLRIIVSGDLDTDLSDFIDLVIEHYDGGVDESMFRGDLEEFLRDRLYFLFRDLLESRDDEIRAGLDVFWTRPQVAYERIQWLTEWRGTDRFEDLYTTAERINNITEGVERQKPDPDLFEKSEEVTLWETFQSEQEEIKKKIERGEEEAVLGALADLRDVTDVFFEEVMVMAEDEALKNNRLALLRSVRTVFDRVANFSRIQMER